MVATRARRRKALQIMARCNCAGGSCSCVIQGAGGIDVTGGGSEANPYVISGGGELDVTDTDTVNLTLTGTGSVVDPYELSAEAVLNLTELLDVDTSGGSTGDVVALQVGGGFALDPPSTAPVGAINVGFGLSGDGSGGDPLTVDIPAWTAWVPVITAPSTNPDMTGSTIVARYMQIGKTVHFNLSITLSFAARRGVGVWSITLPVTAYSPGGTTFYNFVANLRTTPNGTSYVGSAISSGDGLRMAAIRFHNDTSASDLSNTFPSSMGPGSVLSISGTYEAA